MPDMSKVPSKGHAVPKFSVLTVSKRTGWELGASNCIDAQTAIGEHWYIVSPRFYTPKEALKTDGRIPRTFVPEPPKIRASNLNAALNAGLRMVKTPYVIFYQDFIDIPNDCFEKLLGLVDENTFVTTATINADGTDDSRYIGADFPRRIRPEEWEANVAIAPMKIIKKLGGFWEELDNGWSWDNVHLAQRAAMLGCKFLIDESNRPQLLKHEQTSKLKLELNGKRCADNIAAIREGNAPLRLNYI